MLMMMMLTVNKVDVKEDLLFHMTHDSSTGNVIVQHFIFPLFSFLSLFHLF